MNEMIAMGQPNRNLYKSIVIGMSICLPAGIGFGIILNQVPFGILAGDNAGLILGMAISIFNRNKRS